MWVLSLGQEDPLEKEMAIHSNILAWRVPMDRGAWKVTHTDHVPLEAMNIELSRQESVSRL